MSPAGSGAELEQKSNLVHFSIYNITSGVNSFNDFRQNQLIECRAF